MSQLVAGSRKTLGEHSSAGNRKRKFRHFIRSLSAHLNALRPAQYTPLSLIMRVNDSFSCLINDSEMNIVSPIKKVLHIQQQYGKFSLQINHPLATAQAYPKLSRPAN